MTEKELTMKRLKDHAFEAMDYFYPSHMVGIFLQGSQNYNLQIENSDVDTKLITLPSFEEIAFNKKPISTTHVRANNEHIDFKDIRLYMQTFRKQNLNFLEILFTEYKIVNTQYEDQWNILVANREKIARYNPFQAIKSMKGIAMEKYHAMEHEYPTKLEVLAKYHYDPKQLHHLERVRDYMHRYIDGENYENCLKPLHPEYLLDIKRGKYDLQYARKMADIAIADITEMADNFTANIENKGDPEVDEILDSVQLEIMRRSIEHDFLQGR